MSIPNFTDPEDPDIYEEEYVMRYGVDHPLDNPLQRLIGSLKWLLGEATESGCDRNEDGLMHMSFANAHAALEAWNQATTPLLGTKFPGMDVAPFVADNSIPGWRFTIDRPEATGIVELIESGYGLRLRFPEYHQKPVALIDLFYRSPLGKDGAAATPFSLALDDPMRGEEPLAAARWTEDGLRVAIISEHDINFYLKDPSFPDHGRAFGYITPIEDAS